MKKEYLILLVVIVGLLAYLVLQDKDQTYFTLPDVGAVDSAKTDRIQITHKARSIGLTRKDAQWFIEPQSYPADPIKVKNMLNAAAELSITALVSESANYDRYDLSDNKKTVVKLFSQGEVQREFEIGRAAPTYQHTFVKLPKDANVYHAKGSLKNTFDLTMEDLRDKIVLSFDQASITALELQKGDQRLSLVKTEKPLAPKSAEEKDKETSAQPPKTKSVWQTADGAAVDQTAVESLLRSFSRLQCDGFLEGKTKDDVKNPAWQVAFKNDQERITLAVDGKKAEDDSHVTAISSSSEHVFQLLATRVQTFEKHMEKLLGNEK